MNFTMDSTSFWGFSWNHIFWVFGDWYRIIPKSLFSAKIFVFGWNPLQNYKRKTRILLENLHLNSILRRTVNKLLQGKRIKMIDNQNWSNCLRKADWRGGIYYLIWPPLNEIKIKPIKITQIVTTINQIK